MEERRRAPRLEEENEVTIIIDSVENSFTQTKIRDIHLENYTKDISKSGAKITTNIHLPVDALIELEFTSPGLQEQMKTLGKVKWIKVVIQDEHYDVGVEFCGPPREAVKKLEEYISWKLKERSINKNPPSVDSENTNPVKNQETALKSGNVNNAVVQEQPSIKNKKSINMAIISLSAIILIAVLFIIFGYTPEFNGLSFPDLNANFLKKFSHDSAVKESATLPPPPAQASATHPLQGATSVPVPSPPPPPPAPIADQETLKIKVIGNSDTKRYHLPGMKYYNSVKAYHRVEFDSETDAVKAGYNKASQ